MHRNNNLNFEYGKIAAGGAISTKVLICIKNSDLRSQLLECCEKTGCDTIFPDQISRVLSRIVFEKVDILILDYTCLADMSLILVPLNKLRENNSIFVIVIVPEIDLETELKLREIGVSYLISDRAENSEFENIFHSVIEFIKDSEEKLYTPSNESLISALKQIETTTKTSGKTKSYANRLGIIVNKIMNIDSKLSRTMSGLVPDNAINLVSSSSRSLRVKERKFLRSIQARVN